MATSMNVDSFNQQFLDEPCELVVRISWCWTKKSGPFPQDGDLCHARARFDQAIDMRTGELIGRGLFNWLEWLTPRRGLGHPYGFAFKKGHLYRLLVREARENMDAGDSGPRRYQVVKLLESDVKEPRLDPYLQFASDYQKAEVERTLLVEGGPSGWATVFGYRRAGMRYIALAEGEDDEPKACTGRLTWMEREGGLAPKTHFDELGVYRVRVHMHRSDPSALMLTGVVRKLHDGRFDTLREEYLRPVELTSALGTFVLNRHYGWYEGTIDYLGDPCYVLLHVEEGSTDATVPLARLEGLCADLPATDRSMRAYAADEMLENASDWCDEELTREEFMSRMGTPSIAVEADGYVEFMYDDGGMFAGHVIVVGVDATGAFDRADIEG